MVFSNRSNNVVNILLYVVGALVVLSLLYLVYAAVTKSWPFAPTPSKQVRYGSVAAPNPGVTGDGRSLHLSTDITDDDFKYLDLSNTTVVPVTDPTNDVQSFSRKIDPVTGQTIWEPNIMIDPVDILGDDEYNRAVDAARPTMFDEQLKRLTTPWVLLKNGSVFWGTPSAGPEGTWTERGCIRDCDRVFKGVFAEDTDHGTWGAVCQCK